MEQNERKKLTIPVLIKIIKETIQGIGEDRVVSISGSLAYATLFSIIPLFSVLAIIGSIFQFELDVRLSINYKQFWVLKQLSSFNQYLRSRLQPNLLT